MEGPLVIGHWQTNKLKGLIPCTHGVILFYAGLRSLSIQLGSGYYYTVRVGCAASR